MKNIKIAHIGEIGGVSAEMIKSLAGHADTINIEAGASTKITLINELVSTEEAMQRLKIEANGAFEIKLIQPAPIEELNKPHPRLCKTDFRQRLKTQCKKTPYKNHKFVKK